MSIRQLPPKEEATSSPDEEALLDGDMPPEETGDMDVKELDDGSAVVTLAEDQNEDFESESFEENLAELLPEEYLNTLGAEVNDLVESDKKSREERDKQYAEGIRRTGLGDDAPGGAEFDGASRAVSPMLAKGCVDFASRAIKELLPANGPCKTHIIGESNEHKLDKAERKKTYINWQLMTQVQENRAEFERLLSQLPLGGSQYKRWWYDAELKRNRTETVYVDDVYLPYNQNDFYTAHRVTHRQLISKIEYERRVASGLYRDLNLAAPSMAMTEQSKSKVATDKVEGAEEDYTAYNDEGLREIFQIYIDLDVTDDPLGEKRTSPYIMHLDAVSGRVLGLYRNWKEDDERHAKKHWMVEYIFIPWRGAYGVGLAHLIGSLSAAATGALRALLDSAHIQNFPGGLKLKGGRTAGQSINVNATELAEIEAPPGVDDIRKLVMAFPFNGPSPVLVSMLEWLTQQAEVVVATASEKIADGAPDMPMGTALALIEHGSVNFSAIHSRLHASLKRELEIVHRLNAEHLQDEEVVEELGELVVSREDFQGPMDIEPVSDPNIFSEAQRYAQLQAVMQLLQNPVFSQFFKPERLLQRALKLLQIPSPEDIANLPKDPQRLGPLEENYVVSSTDPSPIKVYQEQDDIAHLEAHVHFMTSPMFGSNPLIGVQALPPLMAHCKDHLLAYYRKQVAGAAAAMQHVSTMKGLQISKEEAESKGAAFADMAMSEILGKTIMPALMQAYQTGMQLAPKPPTDPNIALQESTKVQLKQLELAYEKERDQADRATNQQAAGLAAQVEQNQQTTEKQLAEYSTTMTMLRDQQNNQAEVVKQELAGQQANLELVLKQAVAQYGVPPETMLLVQQLTQSVGNQSQSISALAQNLEQTRLKSEQDNEQIRALMMQIVAGLESKAAPMQPPQSIGVMPNEAASNPPA